MLSMITSIQTTRGYIHESKQGLKRKVETKNGSKHKRYKVSTTVSIDRMGRWYQVTMP